MSLVACIYRYVISSIPISIFQANLVTLGGQRNIHLLECTEGANHLTTMEEELAGQCHNGGDGATSLVYTNVDGVRRRSLSGNG